MSAKRIQDIVARLKSPNEAEWEAAEAELREMGERGLSLEEGRQALLAATEDFPPRRYSWQDPAKDFVLAVERRPLPDYVPLVVELFPRFSQEARSMALRLLASTEDREASLAYMGVLRAHVGDGLVPELGTLPLRLKPRDPDVFFPGLLDYTIYPHLASEACTLCLKYCRAGLLDPATLLPWLGRVLAVYAERRDVLFSAQQPEGVAWMWEDGYWQPRHEAADLLALLGYFHDPAAEAELRHALAYSDPVLKGAAVVALLLQGREVDLQQIEEVAAAAEVRGELWDRLAEMSKLDLYPDRFRTQEALAESSMVRWLTSFNELDRVPDEGEPLG